MWEKDKANETVVYRKQLTFSQITMQLTKVGTDYHIAVWGGEKPHIGCTVLALPRLSLTGDGSRSATASVLNVTGHKDEQICRHLAEQAAKRTGATVVCTGGFHIDGAAEGQIQEVLEAVKEAADELQFEPLQSR